MGRRKDALGTMAGANVLAGTLEGKRGSVVQKDDDSDGTGLTRRPRHKPRQASGCEPLPHAYSQ